MGVMAFAVLGSPSLLWHSADRNHRMRENYPFETFELYNVGRRAMVPTRCGREDANGGVQRSWMDPNGAKADSYAGWSTVGTASNDYKLGLLQIGMGFTMAVGFAFASHLYLKKGSPMRTVILEQYEVSISSNISDTLTMENTTIEPSEPDIEDSSDHQTELDISKLENAKGLLQHQVHAGQVSFPIGEVNGDVVCATHPDDVGTSDKDLGPVKDSSVVGAELATSVALSTDINEESLAYPQCQLVAEQPEDNTNDLLSDKISLNYSHLVNDLYVARISTIDEVPKSSISSAKSLVNKSTSVELLDFPLTSKTDSTIQCEDFNSSQNGKSDHGPSCGSVTPSSCIEKLFPGSEFSHFTSLGVSSPTMPSAVAGMGRVMVPAVIDHAQEHAMAALQSLKVMEPGVKASDICSRREYARWLMLANRSLARTPGHKVLPAMYIVNVTELAFDDVLPDDPDFPYIQGLAEAGLISSKLSRTSDIDIDTVLFSPDGPLSRQDLIGWKLALEHRNLTAIDLKTLQSLSGFIDIEQIHSDAWPAIAADLSSGEHSIIATAFGYTRRFQANKPVTNAQAAVAIVSGEAAEHVAEELARFEAEKLAEDAVAAEIALEARAQVEVNSLMKDELEDTKQRLLSTESYIAELKTKLETMQSEIEQEKIVLFKDRIAMDLEKESLSILRADLESLFQATSSEKVQLAFERERLEQLRLEAEEQNTSFSRLRTEAEIEKSALILARTWAEEEAKKARAHAKVLEDARKRWESQGIEVHVDKELDGSSIPELSWQYDDKGIHNQLEQDFWPKKLDILKLQCMDAIKEIFRFSASKFSHIQQQTWESLLKFKRTAEELCLAPVSYTVESVGNIQSNSVSVASSIFSNVSQASNKLADGWRESADKLTQIFKN